MKFSAISYPRHLHAILWHWADVAVGGLGMSSALAVQHFLSANFALAVNAADKAVVDARSFCESAASKFDNVEWSAATTGIFGSFLLPQLPADLAERTEAFEAILDATGASFIPGTRSHVPSETGFCFRVNLARDCTQFRGALLRLLAYLNARSR